MSEHDVPQSILDRFKKVATPTVLGVLRKRGYELVFMQEVYPMTPGVRLAARARTLRFLPMRPDLRQSLPKGEDAPEYQAMALCGAGDVLVVDAQGIPYGSIGGDVKFLQLKMQGAAGIVTDGGIRDLSTVAAYGLAVFARRRTPKAGPSDFLPARVNEDIQCGGVLVRPGDVLVGDDDGVVVVPQALAEEVVAEAEETERIEEFIKERILKEKCRPGRYYPPNELALKLWQEHKGGRAGR